MSRSDTTAIRTGELPPGTLLAPYRSRGAYTDCYHMDLPGAVPLQAYVEAFYTTRLFRIERLLLRWLVRRPSTDAQARQLALGQTTAFAAWTVEARASDQLLLCDFMKRTRSWLMVRPVEGGGAQATRLYFGSAVVPLSTSASGRASFGLAFHALGGFHRLYTRALMRAARQRLALNAPGAAR
jgi:hypothetical protein